MNWFRKRIALLALLALAGAGSANAQGRDLPDFVKLVEDQGAVVVNISTTQAVRRPASVPQIPQVPGIDDEEVQEFFRRFIPRQQPGPQQGPRPESRSLGSGFIIAADGYILTNTHVIDGADEITVKLTDKREYKAKVIGTDKRTDVALIKIEPSAPLPAVKFADPNKLKVGEWVVAIGSPFGFENTVTAGIVSAKGRSLPQENFVPFIQTDVAINPGNSGGPLFNMRGEVVGMNSQIYSRTGGFMGLSFAIPIDVALDIQKQLREKGRVSRGRIGGSTMALLFCFLEHFGAERAGAAGGDFVACYDNHPRKPFHGAQSGEDFIEHGAGQPFPLPRREEAAEALLGVLRRFHRQQREDHIRSTDLSTPRASAFFCAVPVMIVFVTTARIPSFSTAGARGLSARSRTNTSTRPRYNRATPSAETSMPMPRIISAAGPLSARPPIIGEMATAEHFLRRNACLMPGTARMGPMLMIGFEGQNTIAEAERIAARTPGAGRADSAPWKSTPSTLSCALRRTK